MHNDYQPSSMAEGYLASLLTAATTNPVIFNMVWYFKFVNLYEQQAC